MSLSSGAPLGPNWLDACCATPRALSLQAVLNLTEELRQILAKGGVR